MATPAVTQLKDIEPKFDSISFKWPIHEFRKHAKREPGYRLHSPAYSYKAEDGYGPCYGCDERLDWYLDAYPKGDTKEELFGRSVKERYLSVYFNTERGNSDAFVERIKVHLSILNDAFEKVYVLEKEDAFNGIFDSGESIKLVKTETLLDSSNGLLPNDTLIICCEITHLRHYFDYPITKLSDCDLGNDFSELLKNGKFSDVTLSVENEKFKLHKIILAGRSSVFAKMFLTKTKEKDQSYTIANVNKVVFKDMLQYIYSGKSPDVKSPLIKDLLVAAARYDLQGLKTMCGRILSRKLTTHNAFDLLMLADINYAEELQKAAEKVFYSSLSEFLKSEKGVLFMRHQTRLQNKFKNKQSGNQDN